MGVAFKVEGPWAVKIFSQFLGEEIYLVDSEEGRTILPEGEDVVIYTADEVIELIGLSPEKIQKIHEIKKIFKGTIQGGKNGEGKKRHDKTLSRNIRAEYN